MASTPAQERLSRFSEVLARELDAIAKERAARAPAGAAADALQRAQEMQLQGLALSGGGVRSATFNLGVIQALCERGMLRCFDYLSTVSGGGFIGGWLSAQRRHGRSLAELEAALSPTLPRAAPGAGNWPRGGEDPSIGFLRQYSNYLTPRVGLLSIDTLSAVATYVRNVILIQANLIALLIAVLLVPHVLHYIVEDLPAAAWVELCTSPVALAGAFLLLIGILTIVGRSTAPTVGDDTACFYFWWVLVPLVLGAFVLALAFARDASWPLPGFLHAWGERLPEWLWTRICASPVAILGLAAVGLSLCAIAINTLAAPHTRRATTRFVVWWIILPATAGALLFSMAMAKTTVFPWTALFLVIGVGYGLLGAFVALFPAATYSALRRDERPRAMRRKEAAGIFIAAVAAGWIGSNFAEALHGVLAAAEPASAILFAVSIGPFVLLAIFSLVVVIHLGLVGRIFDYQVHEWWARYGGWILKITLFGAGAFGIAAYGPLLADWATQQIIAAGGVAWVLTTLWGVLKGASPSTNGEKRTIAERLLPVAPYVFIIGLALVVSYAIHPVFTATSIAPFAMVVVLGVYAVLARRLDINLFSLHAFYRNRITRCYLGGARMNLPSGEKRQPHPFTGFDPRDDIELASLERRPYHLINAALNITVGRNLAWQQRQAASFFFSPLYCGFEFPQAMRGGETGGFVRTSAYMRDPNAPGAMANKGAMLGSALAVSGAAVSPNWGYHTSTPVAFLLTLFNLRIGRWCPNPAKADSPARQAPAWGGWVLLRELFALTDADSNYLYLSDGGHFDNLGVYELVRRRTRLIVAVDCGEDGESVFDDLADAIRKCAIDMGVRIEIDVDALKPRDPAHPVTAAHVAKGIIDYPKAGAAEAFQGVLIVVKPSLGDDFFRQAPELLNYSLRNKQFPQHSTTDQWFNEAQFESYRKLGYLIGRGLANDMLPHHVKC